MGCFDSAAQPCLSGLRPCLYPCRSQSRVDTAVAKSVLSDSVPATTACLQVADIAPSSLSVNARSSAPADTSVVPVLTEECSCSEAATQPHAPDAACCTLAPASPSFVPQPRSAPPSTSAAASSFAAGTALSHTSERHPQRCNSVTIKCDTNVKDAAGAVVHVLDRIVSLFMTALRTDGSHESLNRAVKSLVGGCGRPHGGLV